MTAFEAVGFAKFSDRVAVCVASSGPGAVDLLNGLDEAKLEPVPVVAIVGQIGRSAMGGSYQQEIDLVSLFEDVCSDYGQMCTAAQQLPNLPRCGHRTRHRHLHPAAPRSSGASRR